MYLEADRVMGVSTHHVIAVVARCDRCGRTMRPHALVSFSAGRQRPVPIASLLAKHAKPAA